MTITNDENASVSQIISMVGIPINEINGHDVTFWKGAYEGAKDGIAVLCNGIKELEAVLAEKDTEISLLRDEINRLEAHCPAFAEILAEKDRQISLLIRNMDADSKEIEVLHGRIDEKGIELIAAKVVIDDLERDAKEADVEIDRLRAEVTRLTGYVISICSLVAWAKKNNIPFEIEDIKPQQ